jgi:hypothetical protein
MHWQDKETATFHIYYTQHVLSYLLLTSLFIIVFDSYLIVHGLHAYSVGVEGVMYCVLYSVRIRV